MARIFSARTLLLGGLAAGAAYAARNREKVMGLLGGGSSSSPEPYAAPAGTAAVQRDEPMPPPPVANVDVGGPPANTATHVPAPEPFVHEAGAGIDELAEEEAAAAEAANIGGVPEEYPSEEDLTRPLDEAMRPVEEAGGGYSEGRELAESDLIDNAEPAAGDPIDGERAIDDVIEAQDEGGRGEIGESDEATLQTPLADAPPPSGAPAIDLPPPPEDAPDAAAITPSGTAMPEESTPAGESPDEDDSRPQDGSS
ncbi:MAG: hypothetical protein WKF94_03375 [Solirubrobacteraceae bacterium]